LEARRQQVRRQVLASVFRDCMRLTYSGLDEPVVGHLVLGDTGQVEELRVHTLGGTAATLLCPSETVISRTILGTTQGKPWGHVERPATVIESLCSRAPDGEQRGCTLGVTPKAVIRDGVLVDAAGMPALGHDLTRENPKGNGMGFTPRNIGFIARIFEVDLAPPPSPKPPWMAQLLDNANTCLNQVLPYSGTDGIAVQVRVPEGAPPVVTEVYPRWYDGALRPCLNGKLLDLPAAAGTLVMVQFDVEPLWDGPRWRRR